MEASNLYLKPPKSLAFGEVVESQITKITVECWKEKLLAPEYLPNFASLIKIESTWGRTFACVHAIKTGSAHPHSRAIAFGLTHEQLKSQQPQIFDLISTWIEAKIFGHSLTTESSLKTVFSNAPRPCNLHEFATIVSKEEFLELAERPMFFFYLLKSLGKDVDIDQVAFCLIARLARLKSLDEQFFTDFYEQYCHLPDTCSSRARLLFLSLEQLLA